MSKYQKELEEYAKISSDFTYAVKMYVDNGKPIAKRTAVDTAYNALSAYYNSVKTIVANDAKDKDAISLGGVADVDFDTQTKVYHSL